jgi:hypothetical protein
VRRPHNRVFIRRRPNRKADHAPLWRDPERRRALLLSLLVHLAALLGVAWFYVGPRPSEPENLVVLELATPDEATATVDAPSVDAPAPQAPQPEVAAEAVGEATVALPTPPEGATPAEAALPESASAAARAEAPAAPEAADVAPEERTFAPPPSAPPPEVAAPEPPPPSLAEALPQLPMRPPSTTLPEIAAPEIAPQPLAEAIDLPRPNPEVSVAPARLITVAPQVELAEAAPLPQPEVRAEVASRALPQPAASAEVTAAAPLPEPQVQVSVASRALPQPAVSASVAEADPVPLPSVTAEIPTRAVPQPTASAAVSASVALPQPEVAVALPAERPLAVTPSAVLADTVPLELPEVTAAVAPAAAQAPEPAEGTAPATTQAQADETAQAGAQGAAASPDGAEATGARAPQTFNATVLQPLAVLLDNTDVGYPQLGLQEATAIFEMPVEGGLTRLMSVYTQGEPARVGPIRSARDYFLEAALRMNGTLVHVGGAPSTVHRIASQEIPTVDALAQGELFAQAADRAAPYSTFAAGTDLRGAVGRLAGRPVSGVVFQPAADAPDAAGVTVDFSADYSSGFRYLREVDQYRWVRSGEDATDAAGNAVVVDAVVVAEVTAFPFPGDPEGRLYLPYEGGAATLYVRGKAVPGRWTPAGGFQFVAAGDEVVDLTPFRHWIVFAPEGTVAAPAP